jgi:hypothetical protein
MNFESPLQDDESFFHRTIYYWTNRSDFGRCAPGVSPRCGGFLPVADGVVGAAGPAPLRFQVDHAAGPRSRGGVAGAERSVTRQQERELESEIDVTFRLPQSSYTYLVACPYWPLRPGPQGFRPVSDVRARTLRTCWVMISPVTASAVRMMSGWWLLPWGSPRKCTSMESDE